MEREQRAAEQRQQELAEQRAFEAAEASEADASEAGDGGNWCGASRDGDGDGIWCED